MTFQPEFEILAKSEDEFFWKMVPAEIKFVKGADGQVEKAIHRQGGAVLEAPKIK
jgi:hypothetical protein